MSEGNVLKLRLSLMGRPVRNYTFDKPVVTIGRDPESDVFVDNPGVSRDHFRLERTPAGEYHVIDLGSANGTFVNDQQVNTAALKNNDVVRFGKYTLWVGYEQDRRALGANDSRRATPDTEQHTVVMSRNELGHLLEVAKEKEAHPATPPPAMAAAASATQARVSAPPQPAPIAALVISFVLGAALGAGAMWLVLGR